MARPILMFLAFVILAPSAQATTFVFGDFDTTGWQDQVALGGATIQGATEVDGQIDVGSADVGNWRYRGLGVRSPDDSGLADGTDMFDSYGANDAVVFRFDRAVRLERISFAATDWWDRFDLYLGEDLTYQRTFKVEDFSGYDWVSTILLGAGYEGTTFAIGAAEYQSCGYSIAEGHGCWTENSAFRMTGLTFSEIELTNVPLPSTGLLLMSAMLGYGAMSAARRRREGRNCSG